MSVEDSSSVTLDAEARPAAREPDPFGDYLGRIEAAESKAALSAVVDDMKHYDGLVASELSELIAIARRRYNALPETRPEPMMDLESAPEGAVELTDAADDHVRQTDAYGRWCRTIQTTEDESTLAELSAAIEGDQQLSPAERNALQKLLQSNRDEAAITATVVD